MDIIAAIDKEMQKVKDQGCSIVWQVQGAWGDSTGRHFCS